MFELGEAMTLYTKIYLAFAVAIAFVAFDDTRQEAGVSSTHTAPDINRCGKGDRKQPPAHRLPRNEGERGLDPTPWQIRMYA